MYKNNFTSLKIKDAASDVYLQKFNKLCLENHIICELYSMIFDENSWLNICIQSNLKNENYTHLLL